jgi:hypothetical protein
MFIGVKIDLNSSITVDKNQNKMCDIKINVCGNNGIVSHSVYYFGKGLYKIGEISVKTVGSFVNSCTSLCRNCPSI